MRRVPHLLTKAIFNLGGGESFGTGLVLSRPVVFVNGSFTSPSPTTSVIPVEDPCTNSVIGEVPNLGGDETLQAIEVAKSAFNTWRNTMPRERSVILHRWSQLIYQHKDPLGRLLSRESGKVLSEGVGECLYAARFLEWYAGEAERVYGDIIGGPRPDVSATVLRRPVGVVGVITPWNFPSAMVTRAVGGALAAGCVVVLKPSELTPFSALALAQLGAEAGVPDGVFNVITGDAGPIGSAMLDSSTVRKISFTGSTRVGKYIYERAAGTMKRLGLELGGNAPFIVLSDADVNCAVEGLMSAKFRAAGQACISSNRVFVHSAVYDAFLQKLAERVKRIRTGNSFDPLSTMGALISKTAVDRVEAIVRDAVEKGAKVEVGGKRLMGPGYFFEPTLLTGVKHNSMRCCQEEVFGPVIPVIEFNDDAEVVQLANATPSGLAAYVYTQSYRKQKQLAEQLDFGMIGINDTGLSAPCAPFGGIKESGLGRDGSKYGIEAFLDIKYILESCI